MNKDILYASEILSYIESEGWELKHDANALAFAAEETAMRCNAEPMSIIKFMLGDVPIAGHYTHSYGFHTRDGRAMREFFSTKYEEYEQRSTTIK